MPFDENESRSFHLGCCVSIPDSFPECAEVSLVADCVQVSSHVPAARSQLVKAVQRLSPTVTICTFVRPEDIRAVFQPPKEEGDGYASDGEWSYGRDVREFLTQEPINAAIFVTRNLPILIQQQVATHAGSDLDVASMYDRAWQPPGGGCKSECCDGP